MIRPKGYWKKLSADGVCAFSIEEGACLMGHLPGSGTGIVVWIQSSDCENSAVLESLLRRAPALLGCPANRIQWKIAGLKPCAETLRGRLTSMGLALEGVAEREAKRLEIQAFPGLGRLRVATQSTPVEVAPPQTSSPLQKNSGAPRIKVLIIDDSKSIRSLLTGVLARDPGIEVVGMAGSAQEAMQLIQQHKPDVLTLDIHMPDMNGVDFHRYLMGQLWIPTIIVSSISFEEGPLVLAALEQGAVDYVQKPVLEELPELGPVMVEKIKTAASIKSRPKRSMLPKKNENPFRNVQLDFEQVLAIGSSTGGTEALRLLLGNLPDRIPGVVIVQHIPPIFSAAFAKRMNELCPFEVKEAEDGDSVQPNRVLIAPGDFHMQLIGKGKTLRVRLDQSPARNGHRPSVDVLFDSVARQVGTQAVGVILTGMGADGAKGLLKMRQAGARTIGQSEESCVVYGMPREAAKIGAVEHVADLDKIPELLAKLLAPRKKKAA